MLQELKAPCPRERRGDSGSLPSGNRPSDLLMETEVFSERRMDARQPKSNNSLLQIINSLAILKYFSVIFDEFKPYSHGYGSRRIHTQCSL